MKATYFGAAIALTAVLAACGGGGGGGGSGSSTPPAIPFTMNLSTLNGVVSAGQPVTLTWLSSGSSCTGQGDWSGDQGAGGVKQVTLSKYSVFTLNCTDGHNTASATLHIDAIGGTSTTNSTTAYSATGLTSLSYVLIQLDPLMMVSDSVDGLIHAITTSDSSISPQSLVSIDPVTAQVVASTPLTGSPWNIAVSGDGLYVYVMFTAQGAPIERYKVAGLVPDLSIPLDSSAYSQGVAVSSTSSTTIAVTEQVTIGNNQPQSELQIFDGKTPRPKAYLTADLSYEHLLTPVWTPDDSSLTVPGYGIRVFAVNAQGVTFTKQVPVGGAWVGRLHGNLFFDDNGNVIDLDGPVAQVGAIADHDKPLASQYVENMAIGKTFTMESDLFQNRSLASYSTTQFNAIDSIQVPLPNGFSGPGGGNLILWGSDGVAWNEGGYLVIAHGSFVQQGGTLPPIVSLPSIAAGNAISHKDALISYVMYDIDATDVAADTCGHVYAAIGESATFFANSVVSFDPMSGAVVTSAFASSQPTALAAADDCSVLYAAPYNSNRLTRLSLPSLSTAAVIPLTQLSPPANAGEVTLPYAKSISVAPGNANTVAVVLNFHGLLCDSGDYGLAIYDDTTPRPNVFSNSQFGPKAVVWGKDSSTLYEEDWIGINSLKVDSSGASQSTQLVPYTSLEGDTDIYDLSANLYFDPAKSRVMSDDGAAFDTVTGTEARTPIKPVINGNGCNLWGAVTSDRQSGKVFLAQYNSGSAVDVITLDSQTLAQTDVVTILAPTGMQIFDGPTRIVRVDSSTVALVTSQGYVIALRGAMFDP